MEFWQHVLRCTRCKRAATFRSSNGERCCATLNRPFGKAQTENIVLDICWNWKRPIIHLFLAAGWKKARYFPRPFAWKLGKLLRSRVQWKHQQPRALLFRQWHFVRRQKKRQGKFDVSNISIWRNRFVKVHEPSARLTRLLRQRSHN
jgi:hypothetical protein